MATRIKSNYYTQAADAAEKIALRADDFALDQLQTLRALIEHELIPSAVEGRRRAGATWEDIGRDLGMSRQGAHQRFSPPAHELEFDHAAGRLTHCQCGWKPDSIGAQAEMDLRMHAIHQPEPAE